MKTKLMRISSILLAVLLLLSAFTVLPISAQASTQESSAGADTGARAVTTGTDANGSYKRLEALLERGGVETDYSLGYGMSQYGSSMRSAYDIKTGGATSLALESIDVSHGEVYIQFFTANYDKISYIDYTLGTEVDIPWDCDFIRIEIVTTAEPESVAIRFYGGQQNPREVKRNGFNTVSEKLTYKVNDDLFTTSRLKLPTNYTIDGQKAPVILWLEGSGGNFCTWDGDFDTNHQEAIQYLADEGFAVYTIYTWGNIYAQKYPNCGKALPYPTPTNLACLKKGIEYVCDRYNLDPNNVHIMSKSQGGQSALYYATCNELNVKSIGMFAPVLDYLSMPGEELYADTRAAIAEDMGFVGDVAYFVSSDFCAYHDRAREFFRQNLDKLAIMNEAWTGLSADATLEELFEEALDDCETFWTEKIWNTNRTDIYTNKHYVKTASVPVKIWGAPNDAATPYLKMVEVVEQLKNGGCEAEMRTFAEGGHGCADYNNTMSGVVTASGTVYNGLGIGWVENVEWIRAHTPSQDGETCDTLGHDYGDWSTNYDKTHSKVCANDVTHKLTENCNYNTPEVVPATCMAGGFTLYTCSVCGGSYKEDKVDASGHTDENGDFTCDVCNKPLATLSGETTQTNAHCASIAYGTRTYYYTSVSDAVSEALAGDLPEVVLLKNFTASTRDAIYISGGKKLTIKGAEGAGITLHVTVNYGIQVDDYAELVLENLKLTTERLDPAIKYDMGANGTFKNVDMVCKWRAAISGATNANHKFTFADSTIGFYGTPDASMYLIYFAGIGTLDIETDGLVTDIAIAKFTDSGTINLNLTDITKSGTAMTSIYIGSPRMGEIVYGDDATAKTFGFTHRVGDVEGGAPNEVYFKNVEDARDAAATNVKVWDISGTRPVDVTRPCAHVAQTMAAVPPTCTSPGLTAGSKCTLCHAILVEQESVPPTDHTDENGDFICDGCMENLELPLTGAAVQTTSHVASITYGTHTYYYTSFDAAVVEALEYGLPEVVLLKDTTAVQGNESKYIADGADLTVTAVSKSVTLTVYYRGFLVYDGSLTFKDMKLVLDCSPKEYDAIVYYENAELTFDNVDIVCSANTCAIERSGGSSSGETLTFIDCTISVPTPSSSAYLVYVNNNKANITVINTTTNAAIAKSNSGGTIDMTVNNVTLTNGAAYVLPNGSTNVTVTDVTPEVCNHSYVAVVTAPTCTEAGYTTYTCAGCGDVYVEAGAAASGHAYGSWVANGDKTHTKTCTNDATHKVSESCAYTSAVTAPTCTEDGYTTYTCACGDTYTANEVAALGHTWNSGVVTTDPTCTEKGVKTVTCEVCGDTYTDEVAALGHTWNSGVITTDPTETDEGVKTFTCEVCGATRTESVPELSHTHAHTASVTAPTCTEDGYTTYTCRCGDSYVADEVAALGHSYEAVVTAPTCTDAG
ncbi:MAG: hypothetical protein J6U87_06285 [Clostridia bacterium]|nr:hypothetical protein [Clostridia bacterium]